ncbi:hypothetical protein DEM27_30535 [Metarhizobium album]|uniref:ABC transporter domain-containing protein n=1 Tax=Metarhizobium album TaxID=2182425 RepID=A0A2U2DGW7_9HYPH|nr:ATP-binding cassette domain-containing protein [Rhizobium album]PWE52508.1 hypothetical protein DEM27_30535 [Rhizobium album]
MAILHAEGIEKRYGARTVGPVSFMLAAGETGLVLGGSGSGKSTLLDLIHGTRRASAGAAVLHIGGWRRDLFNLSVPELVAARRAAIGYCTQFLPAIPGRTGLDLARQVAPSVAAEAVFERLALPPRIWNLPASSWSGGEKQRLNLALAALRRPPLLLLDEPFAALDRALHPVLRSFLTDLAEEGTALLIALHHAEDGLPAARTLVSLNQPAKG